MAGRAAGDVWFDDREVTWIRRAPDEFFERRRARRRRQRRRRARLRLALLLFVLVGCFFGARFVAAEVGSVEFDRRFRPDHAHVYANEELRFRLEYPARLELVDVTRRLNDLDRPALAIGFAAQDDPSATLVLMVRRWEPGLRLTRDEASELTHDLRGQVATGLRRELLGRDGVRRVRVRSTLAVSIGGVPSIRSRAEVWPEDGGVLLVERVECLSRDLHFSFELEGPRGDPASRERLERVLASFSHETRWGPDGQDGAQWVIAGGPTPARTTF